MAETVHITGLSPQSIYNLVHRYLRSHQIESLHDLSHTGRPPAAPDLTAARIIREWFISADLHSSAMILLVVFLEEDGGQGWG